MDWNDTYQLALPHMVEILTPLGSGTGYLLTYCGEDKQWAAIATAAHVVNHAHVRRQPIKIRHHASDEMVRIDGEERYVFVDRGFDSAQILIRREALTLPDTPIPLLPASSKLGVGLQVGWLGFPAFEHSRLCFFTGNVSAGSEWRGQYLVDGVAIEGVSGGPVLHSCPADGVQVVGILSGYAPNLTKGAPARGLLRIQDVYHAYLRLNAIQSPTEAARKQEEEKEAAFCASGY